VREIDEESYLRILSNGKLHPVTPNLPNLSGNFESESPTEGTKKHRYTSYYERLPYYRNKAIEIHGLSCQVCDFNFKERYGELGKGFIHVHHNKPVSESGPTAIDPEKDLSVLCPNCHAMVHRKKGQTMSVQTLQDIIGNGDRQKSST
jgi:predicted HNH restriction endonuclease